MAQARRERSTASGPAGWVVLLGLMVLALVIAAASDGCGTDETSPAAQTPTPTSPTGTAPAAAAGQQVIDQINAALTSGGLPFVVGKSELAPASTATLDQIAVVLKDNAAVKAEVRGFTLWNSSGSIPSRAMSCSWVPSSAIRPFCKTRIRLAR